MQCPWVIKSESDFPVYLEPQRVVVFAMFAVFWGRCITTKRSAVELRWELGSVAVDRGTIGLGEGKWGFFTFHMLLVVFLFFEWGKMLRFGRRDARFS